MGISLQLRERIEKGFAKDISFVTLPIPNSICIAINSEGREEKPLTQCFTEATTAGYLI